MQIAEEKRKNKIKNVGAANKRRAGLFTAIGEGSAATKASAVFMGSGQIARGQIIKGIFYLAAETAFVLFMIFFRRKVRSQIIFGQSRHARIGRNLERGNAGIRKSRGR